MSYCEIYHYYASELASVAFHSFFFISLIWLTIGESEYIAEELSI